MIRSRKLHPGARGGMLGVAIALCALPALGQTPQKPPIAQYWMDVATNQMSIPGMPAGGAGGGLLGGLMSGAMGSAAGVPGMGNGKTLGLGLVTRNKPQGALAQHTTPPPARFEQPLPLVPPQRSPSEPGTRTEREPHEQVEKPRARMLIYWGCSETVRAGQPRVLDTATMSPMEFGKALASRGSPDRGSALSLGRSIWPNHTERRQVPADSSLEGPHQVAGEGVPDIRFTLGANQNFMAPLDITLAGDPAQSVGVEWQPVPTARAFFASAMGSKGEGEMVIWSSSEVPETGFGLFDYLPNATVDRWVTEKVLMPASASRCAIPAGIFAGAQGAMVRMIGYGHELHLVHPPRPADPKAPWDPIWAARVREKSTGMAMLGADSEGRGRGRPQRSRDRAPDANSDGGSDGGSAPAGAQAPAAPAEAPAGGLLNVNPINVLRGIFGR